MIIKYSNDRDYLFQVLIENRLNGFFGIVLENHNNIKKGNQKNASPIDRDTLNYYIILIVPTC